jgi:hypothetical protein
MSAGTSATEELSPSHGLDLDCETILPVQRQAGNYEKHLIIFGAQTESISKVAAMVIACIEHSKSEQLGIGEET